MKTTVSGARFPSLQVWLRRPPVSPDSVRPHTRRTAIGWALLGLIGFSLVPWYATPDGIWALAWPTELYGQGRAGAGLAEALGERGWLVPFAALPPGVVAAAWYSTQRDALAAALLAAGALGLAWLTGIAVVARDEPGFGLGAVMLAGAFVAWIAQGLAVRGRFRGDSFASGVVVAGAVLLGLFTVLPTGVMLLRAVEDRLGGISLALFGERLLAPGLWHLDCLGGSGPCGTAWNTLALALATATLCTILGLALALLVARTSVRFRQLVRTLSLLPIVTPPFIVGMGLILLFGRSGLFNALLEWAFGVPPTRWIYGLHGVLLAQVFAFTPVAFLVLIGVVQGVSPRFEEAAQTLHASRWRTFRDIALPLMKPGLWNAFLICFVESIADFGNPIVLGGNATVLATEIFYSLVSVGLDPGRAAALAVLLLAFTLGAFFIQRLMLRRANYTSLSGKSEHTAHPPLPRGVRQLCITTTALWGVLVVVVYGLVLLGGFVVNLGIDYTPSLRHYAAAFGAQFSLDQGIAFTGLAWDSLFETLLLASIVAPLTAFAGLLLAWVLSRHDFRGRRTFEFMTLLSLAVPGTVTGVAYVLCFNAPPLELTGTGTIIALCLLFRNLPVAVRAGIAAMSQIDSALDEASTTLGARGLYTFRRVNLPLLRSVLLGTWIYGFVRSVTTVSAIIFLVSADHELATSFIMNRVINGDYGVAVAYSTVLILLSLAMFGLLRRLVGADASRPKDPAPTRETILAGAS